MVFVLIIGTIAEALVKRQSKKKAARHKAIDSAMKADTMWQNERQTDEIN